MLWLIAGGRNGISCIFTLSFWSFPLVFSPSVIFLPLSHLVKLNYFLITSVLHSCMGNCQSCSAQPLALCRLTPTSSLEFWCITSYRKIFPDFINQNWCSFYVISHSFMSLTYNITLFIVNCYGLFLLKLAKRRGHLVFLSSEWESDAFTCWLQTVGIVLSKLSASHVHVCNCKQNTGVRPVEISSSVIFFLL